MKINVLSDEQMRELNFTDHREGYWYYCRNLGNEITFNISIKKDGSEFRIDVLNEDFGQPYDYQYYLSQNLHNEFCLKIKDKVEGIMIGLVMEGIISDYKIGDYI